MTAPQGSGREAIAGRLRFQSSACGYLGSPLYRDLLARAAEDAEAGGVVWDVLRVGEHPQDSLPGLRLMGAVRKLALRGEAPELQRLYRQAAAEGGIDAWPAFHSALKRNVVVLRELVTEPVQTNEAGRSAALLGGFLLVARITGLPLALLELGASAGLNLRWDLFRYDSPQGSWGDPASPVRIRCEFDGAPPLQAAAEVVSREGCDQRPLDPTSEEGRLTLLAYVWPDQSERLALLEAAIELAREVPVPVDRAGAGDWLEARLADPRPSSATVVFHSIFLQYLSDAERERIERLVRSAGESASADAPLAWLRMEQAGERADIRLNLWPHGLEERIARAGYHGREIEWLSASASSSA